MESNFNLDYYRSLLATMTPKVIESEGEYKEALATVESLMHDENKSPEETALYLLLVILIEAYESEYYPIDDVAPHILLQNLMEERGTNQSDLVGVIGSSEIIPEVIEGGQPISLAQAKSLGYYFGLDYRVFLKEDGQKD